jgi:hypothetical protein
MGGRLLRVTGTVLVIAVAFVTPTLATSAPASASDTTTVLVPSNNATVSGTKVVLDASASGATSVQFELQISPTFNPVIATATPTLYGWLATWNTINEDNTTYSLASVATFPDNSTVTSPAISITVDNPPPTATVVTPSDGATVSGTMGIDMVPTASATSINLYVTPASSTALLPVTALANATPTLFGWASTWNTTRTANGTYYLFVEVGNRATRQSTSQVVTVTVDNPNPNPPSILVPSNGATVSGTQVVLDTTAPATQFVLWQQPFLAAPFIATATPTIWGEVATWDSTTVPNGTYNLYSITPNLQIPPDWSAGITITVDNPAPTATITSPQDGATVTGTVLFQAVPSPGVAVMRLVAFGPSYPPDGELLATTNGSGTAGWGTEWNTTGLIDGTYTLQVGVSYANNLSGVSPPITVTVAN